MRIREVSLYNMITLYYVTGHHSCSSVHVARHSTIVKYVHIFGGTIDLVAIKYMNFAATYTISPVSIHDTQLCIIYF